MACWRFIGDIDEYVGHRALVVEGAVVEVAEAGMLVTVVVGDVVLKAKEEMPEELSGFEVKLANVKWGAWAYFLCLSLPCFYAIQRVLLVIGLKEFGSVNLVSWLPGVVTFRVPFPFDEVLECSGSSMTLVVDNMFHLIFLFSIDKVRWWLGEVWAVCSCFLIGQ